jgi:hypothetical protein
MSSFLRIMEVRGPVLRAGEGRRPWCLLNPPTQRQQSRVELYGVTSLTSAYLQSLVPVSSPAFCLSQSFPECSHSGLARGYATKYPMSLSCQSSLVCYHTDRRVGSRSSFAVGRSVSSMVGMFAKLLSLEAQISKRCGAFAAPAVLGESRSDLLRAWP